MRVDRVVWGFNTSVVKFQTLTMVATSVAARPWRRRGLPTPISVRMSSPRLNPLACTIGRDEWVVREQPHTERARALRHELADAPQSDDAEHLVGELDSLPPASFPTARGQRSVRLRDVAGLREQQRHGLLGGRQHVRLRRVDHHHAAFGRVVHIDVVETDAGAPDDQRIARLRAEGYELARGHARWDVYLETAPTAEGDGIRGRLHFVQADRRRASAWKCACGSGTRPGRFRRGASGPP